MMEAPLLDVAGLTRVYRGRGRGPGTRALNDVTFAVARGEILGVVGASGCGKSTLARIVATLDRADAGRLSLAGTEYHALAARALRPVRRQVQMVFQDPYGSLDPRQRIGRIVAEPLGLIEPKLSTAERRQRTVQALDLVGLGADALDRHPHAFSGGQRQRIAIARAIVTRPALVVADEAVSALDLSVQAQILNLFLDLQDAGTATLFISHDLAAVGAIADRVAVMDHGRIVELGRTDEILNAPTHPVTRALMKARL